MAQQATPGTLGKWRRVRLVVVAVVVAFWPMDGLAHDPDAWGGLVRTYDAGNTWMPINPGIFVSGALALAVNPRDPDHLLLATDSGVWRSRNGGRDWNVEAPEILTGPAFAAAFDIDGERALVAGRSTLFRHDGDRWRPASTPAGAAPARALVSGSVPGRVYLAGRSGLYRSDDWGRSWVSVAGALQADHVDALVVRPGRPDDVYAAAGGAVWSSSDGARNWQSRRDGFSGRHIEVVGFDSSNPPRLWAVGAGQVFLGDQVGERWRAVGKPVPDAPAIARGVAVSGDVIVMATDRGVFRSADRAERWEPPREGLPAHLGATVLMRDPRGPDILYAGFALTAYEDLQWRAPQKGFASARTGMASMAGSIARIPGGLASVAGGFALLVLIASGVLAAVRLTRSHAGTDRNVERAAVDR